MSPSPRFNRFTDFKLDARLQRAIVAAGFAAPRPVQIGTIPAALEGRDILGLAQTGTGKTAAFALPVLQHLLTSTRAGTRTRTLVVTPTRELAAQVTEEIRRLARFTDLRVTTVFGGVPAGKQARELRRRPDVIVACPGRLLDLMSQGIARVDGVETLVLDEADHMFDMGFLPDLRRILAALPVDRQNLMFSATMPSDIRKLASQVLRRPHVVEVAHSKPTSTVRHALYLVEPEDKLDLVGRLLSGPSPVSAIVFTRTKHRARRLASQLDRAGHRAVALQGNMSQGQRERAMEGFRRQKYDVLVATDIAARGIDVAQVSHVINFDVPGTLDAYTHRIGRTGRAERTGSAHTFVTEDERGTAQSLERLIGSSIPWFLPDGQRLPAARAAATGVPRPGGGSVAVRSRGDGRGRPSRARRQRRR